MSVTSFLDEAGWETVYTHVLGERSETLLDTADLALTPETRCFLRSSVPGLYNHQKVAIEYALRGSHVCLTTGTASGKSLPFCAVGLEKLQADPNARILAIYPLKALAREQQSRWESALASAGVTARVARIDGQVATYSRPDLLRASRVLVATPDILHAWLLNSLSDRSVLAFLRNVSLVVVDEVHTYTGVFGSNSAFLYRRLQHAMSLLGAQPQYLCASATISDPASHLRQLFGLDFELVGPEFDTSPKYPVTIHMVNPPDPKDLLTHVTNLLSHLAATKAERFIAFVDSRKQVEHMSSILSRPPAKSVSHAKGIELDEATLEDDDDGILGGRETLYLQRLDVLPFRAGYEEHDRDAIQDRLSTGSLRGVISTSALELGMDIRGLTVAILVGVPQSSTSLYQRIGRIGRRSAGTVIIINSCDIYDQAVFAEPDTLLLRPLAESALYLGNARIQYIHALCLARQGGEYDHILRALRRSEDVEFASDISWPQGFVQLCQQERRGVVSVDLRSMKQEAGEDPNHAFPLRDVESQFRVQFKLGPDQRQLGSLSHAQLLREAYPGAVYYYITQPYRVHSVYVNSKTVIVRKERRYTTRPWFLPIQVFPDVSAGSVYSAKRYGDMSIAECSLQIRESLGGYKERRGPNEFKIDYPLDVSKAGINFKLPRFTRNYFTTGVIISHPSLDQDGVNLVDLSDLLYEAFLMRIPFERQDIHHGADKHLATHGALAKDTHFLAIYDQTYGSLHLSGRLMDSETLLETLGQAVDLCDQRVESIGLRTAEAMRQLLMSTSQPPMNVTFDASLDASDSTTSIRVILPGSVGLDRNRDNQEFAVEGVYFHPGVQGLAYRGRHAADRDPNLKVIVPVDALIEIPGVSRAGLYDYDTGELSPIEEPATVLTP